MTEKRNGVVTNTEEYLWERIGILERTLTQLIKSEMEAYEGSHETFRTRYQQLDVILNKTLSEASEADAKYQNQKDSAPKSVQEMFFDWENPFHKGQEYWLCCGSIDASHRDERAKTCEGPLYTTSRYVYATHEQHKQAGLERRANKTDNEE